MRECIPPLLIIALAVTPVVGDEGEAFTDPKSAGPDFAVQGEYTGAIETDDGLKQLGVQVIALGKQRFRVRSFPGGLPGDGWNGESGPVAQGQTRGGVTRYATDMGTGEIRDGALLIRNNDGTRLGALNRVVRSSPTLGAEPPRGAIRLYAEPGENWFRDSRLENGLLREGMTSVATFNGSLKLHVEFRLSFMPHARDQARSNSGCYMQGRYEVQILDSFGLSGEDDECGGIYGVRKPDVNMCFPPLSWQTYDVDFVPAVFDNDGNKVANSRMTVRHNGVLIHNNVEVGQPTRAAPLREGPEPGPIYIQNHGSPLHFRNIWIVADHVRTAKPTPPEGFVSLFDGVSLTGWHTNLEKIGHGTGGRWGVEDGAIVGEQDPPGSGNGGILLTERSFGDFELLIDVKPDWGVCSGLYLRGNDRGQCFQVMVDYHDRGNVGHIYGEGTGGFNNRTFDIFGTYDNDRKLTGLRSEPSETQRPDAFSITGSEWLRAWKPNDWNTARVRVTGNPPRITTWLNAAKVSEFDGNTFDDPRYNREKVAEQLGARGRVAVQVHGGTGWPIGTRCRWRNIFIRGTKENRPRVRKE